MNFFFFLISTISNENYRNEIDNLRCPVSRAFRCAQPPITNSLIRFKMISTIGETDPGKESISEKAVVKLSFQIFRQFCPYFFR